MNKTKLRKYIQLAISDLNANFNKKIRLNNANDSLKKAIEIITGEQQVEGLAISTSEAELTVQDTLQLSAYRIPTKTEDNLTYTSSNEDVATVDNKGLVTSKGAGTTIIIVCDATNKSLKSLCHVTVIPKTVVNSINIENSVTIIDIQPFSLNITVDPIELLDKVKLTSSNENVCIIKDNKIVPLVPTGNCIITAKIQDKESKCNVTVDIKQLTFYENKLRTAVTGLTHRFVGSQETDTYSTETGMYNVINNKYFSEVLFNSAHSNQDGWMGKYYALNKGNEIFIDIGDNKKRYCYGAIGFVNKLTDIDLYKDYTIGINFRLLERTRDVKKLERFLLQFGSEMNNYRSIRIDSEKLIFTLIDNGKGQFETTLNIPNYNNLDENKDIFMYITLKQTGINDKNQRLYRFSVFCNGDEVYADNVINTDTQETCPLKYGEISGNIFKITQNINTPSQLYGEHGNYMDIELGLYDLNFFNRALSLDEIKTLYDYEKKLVNSYIPSTALELSLYDIRGIKDSDIDLSYDIKPNICSEQQIDISSTNKSVAIFDRKRNKVKLLSPGECDIIFTLHRDNITKKCHVIVEKGISITKAVVEENPDDYITITLPVQNYQNTDTPTQYNMWTVNKEIDNYTIFTTDTLPYPFELTTYNLNQSSEITMNGFENVKVSNIQNVVSEKAIAGEYKYELNYLYIKVPNSVLDLTTYSKKEDAFAHYLMNNNFQATFKLHKDGNTYKTIVDGNKQIYIDYNSDNKNNDCIVANVELDNLIPWENIRAGRNVFINNWSYCNFQSGLLRNEYNICSSKDHRHLYLNLKIKKSVLSELSVKGISDYLNNNPLTIYTFNDSKNIESIMLNNHDIITNLVTPINLEADITPSDATYAKKVYWFSSDEKIAKVSKGYVIPINTGEVDITAVTDEGKLTDTCHIKIYSASKVNTVSYMKTLDLKEGDSYTTEGYYYYQDGGAATYQIMSYDNWWNSLKEDLKLISYDMKDLIKNPVDEYIDHTLDNGLVAKLVMGDTVLAEQCGISSFYDKNLEAIKHAFAYCRERELKFKKDATYLLFYNKFNRDEKETNEYCALTCCRNTPYPSVGNCEYFNINGNGCTIRLGDPDKFTDRGLFNFSGHINNLTFQGFTIDFQGLLVTETNMIVPTYHALHFGPDGRFSLTDQCEKFGVNIDTTLQLESFTNVKIFGNKVYQPGTAVSLAQSTGSDNGGDFILVIAPLIIENFIVDSNYVEDWGRWFIAIDLPRPGRCYNNVQIINNRCIQTNDNCIITANGDRKFRGMGWTDFETTAYFKNLLVDNNYIYGLVYFAYNGNTQISENMVVTNNHVERPASRSYLRGALDMGCNWYYVYTKNLLVENNEFINCEWRKFGITWEGEINIRNNKNCAVTCYAVGGNINFENNDGGLLWFANNNDTNGCGANYPGYMTENEDGVTLKPEYEKYRTRKFIFKNNKRLDVGANGTEILYDLSDNKIFKDTYFDFQDNDIYRLRIDLWEPKMLHTFDPYQNGHNNNTDPNLMVIRGVEKPLNVSAFNMGGYIVKSGDLISDDITKAGIIVNQNYPYQDASMLGITDEEWVGCQRQFPALARTYGYKKIYCEEGGFCPSTLDLSSFTYLKGKSINPKTTVMSSKQLFIALNKGTLGNTLPVANKVGDVVTCGDVQLKYLYPIAKLKIVKE